MSEAEWFDTDTDNDLDEVQHAFVDVLRARAAGWTMSPEDTYLCFPEYETYGYSLSPGESSHGRALVWVDVVSEVENLIVLAVGAYLDNDRVRGDEIHNQLLTLPEKPTRLALRATGSPEVLAHRTADWFESILRLPAVRYEWLRASAVHARRTVVGDPEQGLAGAEDHADEQAQQAGAAQRRAGPHQQHGGG